MLANFRRQLFRSLRIPAQHHMRHGIRQSPLVGRSHNRCFGNMRMPEQRVLHFHRRNPHARDFQHVVRAPAIVVVTFGIAKEFVAGYHPITAFRARGKFGNPPVFRERARTTHPEISDLAVTLHEPLSIAIHGLLRSPPPDGAAVLVAGAAIIGLGFVAGLRALFPASEITVLAKHEHQAQAAERLGAKHVVRLDAEGGHITELARIAGTKTIGAGNEAMLAGGFPYVVEAVGTPQSITQALRFADGRGTVLFLGITGLVNVDLAPETFKRLNLF